GTPREVRQHDAFVLELIGEFGDVVEMNVAVRRSARFVAVSDEGTFDHQNFGSIELGILLEDAAIGVAGVKQNRDIDLFIDVDAFATQARELVAVASGVFTFEVMAHVEKFEGARGDAMRGLMRAHGDVARDPPPLAGAHADDLDVVVGVLQPRMQRHQFTKIVRILLGDIYGASFDSLKVPLARIKRNADGMIEMRVRDEHVRNG